MDIEAHAYTDIHNKKKKRIPIDKNFIFLTAAKEVANAIHVESERNTHGLVKGIGRFGSNNVTGIHAEHVELEAGTHRGVLTITLHLALVVVTGTKGKLIVVSVLGTYAPLYLLQRSLETTLRIAETLENTADGRLVIILIVQTLLIVFIQLVCSL